MASDGLPRPRMRRTLSLPSRRIGTAIEVVHSGAHEVPGLHHWTPELWSSPGEIGDVKMANAACGANVVGMVLSQGTIDDVSCEDCLVEYVRRRLNIVDDDDLEIGR